jgi:hypothetical protein
MERQVKNPITGWWENQPVPRGVILYVTAAYGFIVASGVSVLLNAPGFLSLGLGGGLLTTYWGGLLVFGGVIGATSAPFGAYWAERIALAALGLALLMYVFAMLELQRQVPSNISYQAWLNVALALHIGVRLERVRHGMKDLRKTAKRPRGER